MALWTSDSANYRILSSTKVTLEVDGSVVGHPFHLTTGTLDGLPTACVFGTTISM